MMYRRTNNSEQSIEEAGLLTLIPSVRAKTKISRAVKIFQKVGSFYADLPKADDTSLGWVLKGFNLFSKLMNGTAHNITSDIAKAGFEVRSDLLISIILANLDSLHKEPFNYGISERGYIVAYDDWSAIIYMDQFGRAHETYGVKNVSSFLNFIWSIYGNRVGIFLATKKHIYDNMEYKIRTLDAADTLYGHGLKRVDQIVNLIKRRNKGVTFLFHGLPGTGKSATGYHISNHLGGRMIRLDANLFTRDNISDIELFFKLEPKVIQIDDIHNIPYYMLYQFMELLEKYNEKFVIILTANEINQIHHSIFRPKRTDEIIEFLPPDLDDRLTIIEGYIGSQPGVQELADLTWGFTGAYIEHYAKDFATDPDIDRIKRDIELRRNLLKEVNPHLKEKAVEPKSEEEAGIWRVVKKS